MNKQERAYAVLRERILDGAYSPGYRLVIDALAQELDVSPLPVREAIRRLEAEGLVVFRANFGAHVAPADPERFEDMMVALAVLEGYAAALAAPLVEASDVDRLRAIDDRMSDAVDRLDVAGFGRANREFHLLLCGCCPNDYVAELLKDVERRVDAIRRTAFAHVPYRGRQAVEEHETIVGLLEAGAAAEAVEAAVRRHKLETLDAFRAWRAGQEGVQATVGPTAGGD